MNKILMMLTVAVLSSNMCAFAQDTSTNSTTASDTGKKATGKKVGKGTDVVSKKKPKDNTADGAHGAVTTDSPAPATK